MRRCQGSDGSERTSQVPAQHEVEHEETVLVILEGVAKVDNEGVVNLAYSSRVRLTGLRQGGGRSVPLRAVAVLG